MFLLVLNYIYKVIITQIINKMFYKKQYHSCKKKCIKQEKKKNQEKSKVQINIGSQKKTITNSPI